MRKAGATSYADLRTHNHVQYETFTEAANAMGLLDSDEEWELTLTEAFSFMTRGIDMRKLFCVILSQCRPSNPGSLWNKFKDDLSRDILYEYKTKNNLPDLTFNDMIYQQALKMIDDILNDFGQKLCDFNGIPALDHNLAEECGASRIMAQEKNYDVEQLYYMLILLDQTKKHRVFFIDGPGGTGKSFLNTQVLNYIRSKSKIALAVASSGIAALLLPGGRTAHSRLKIPIKLTATSTLNLPLQSVHADLIKKAEIILWDEAPMTHRHAYEALDRSLRDVMKTTDPALEQVPFGGKLICFGGDFRQILPVVKKGVQCDTVNASLNKSYLWKDIKVLKLKTNERVKKILGNSNKAKDFAEYLLAIGEGRIECSKENFENDIIEIKPEMLVNDNELDLINIVFPNIRTNDNPEFYTTRSVLSTKNIDVDKFNSLATDMFPGKINKRKILFL